MTENEIQETKQFYLCVKRLLDLIIGLLGAVFLLLPVSVIIFIFYLFGRDKGGIFFTQERMGKKGTTFRIIKFRSMVVNAEEVLQSNPNLYQQYLHNSYKLLPEEDPRLTRIGYFIRKTSIDELPQFINLIKGDMSFIGPRPILASELKEYTVSEQKELLSIKPGATGWWQVSGRSEVLYPERCQLELYYVRNFSFKLDLKIFFLTIKKVFTGEGAH
ncbi:sugar transferase [Streptococcus chenjunshii]|uniref:Sugar transferase n=1 Tax=Streptococcus chenjunshii TaxID=2173853 RepID=A0A372KPH7_9STRE|nr:sugar transferase [Streptococcus chenjunshii]AXQ78530.1 sugar transferase [Streptococcus chenjunshii]RFU52008.1 sugar transferase [Streptococcus chenjunshii]RFU54200.1 sugar transferase [Streptococcus chenjunshii]